MCTSVSPGGRGLSCFRDARCASGECSPPAMNLARAFGVTNSRSAPGCRQVVHGRERAAPVLREGPGIVVWPARSGNLTSPRPACALRPFRARPCKRPGACHSFRFLKSSRCMCLSARHKARISHAPLSHPYLRRAARSRHRQGGAAVRLVPPHPRPRRRAVHRSARPLRPHPGGGRPRFARVQGGREAARGMGGADRRQGAQAPGRHREPRAADRRGRGLYPRDRGAGAGRRAADAGVRRAGISGGDPAQVPVPRPAPRAPAPQHHDARRGDRFDPRGA